uniref:Uncharacterized protein n=1 Tax=Anopheles dirus TaxID=7168 RepID=A0A182N9L4_9DIPT
MLNGAGEDTGDGIKSFEQDHGGGGEDANNQFWCMMLLGFLYIMYDALKCVASVSLSWWQKEPLLRLEADRCADRPPDVVSSDGRKTPATFDQSPTA